MLLTYIESNVLLYRGTLKMPEREIHDWLMRKKKVYRTPYNY